jgi:hypothetical protein
MSVGLITGVGSWVAGTLVASSGVGVYVGMRVGSTYSLVGTRVQVGGASFVV